MSTSFRKPLSFFFYSWSTAINIHTYIIWMQVGHSIGAYIALCIFKQLSDKVQILIYWRIIFSHHNKEYKSENEATSCFNNITHPAGPICSGSISISSYKYKFIIPSSFKVVSQVRSLTCSISVSSTSDVFNLYRWMLFIESD